MKLMLNKYAPYLLAVSLLLLGLSLGFFAGKNLSMPATELSQVPEVEKSSLYSSQTASIRGVITAREGNTLTVKNLNNQATGDIKVSNRVIIAKASNKPSSASPSSDLSKIELNQEALISLEMVNGEYEAIVIQYIVPIVTPSTPPAPTIKPSPSP